MIIRPERADDHAAIRDVVAAAFGSAAEADLVERIRASPEYVAEMALVATEDEEVIGHVMISGAVIGAERRRIVMLSPLAVDPDHQQQGVGGALVRAATAIADERGEPFVILEGNPAYYSRFGFEHSVPLGISIDLPDWAPSEAGQVLRLASFDPDDATLQGVVTYPAAFDAL